MDLNQYRVSNFSLEDIQNIIKENESTSLIRIYNGQIIIHPQIRYCEFTQTGMLFNNIKGNMCFTSEETLKRSFICPSKEVKEIIEYIYNVMFEN